MKLVAKDEQNIPVVARTPPRTAVFLTPIQSVEIDAMNEHRNVIPIANDPTHAINMSFVKGEKERERKREREREYN